MIQRGAQLLGLLIVLAILVRAADALLSPLMPYMLTAAVVAGAAMVFLRRRYW